MEVAILVLMGVSMLLNVVIAMAYIRSLSDRMSRNDEHMNMAMHLLAAKDYQSAVNHMEREKRPVERSQPRLSEQERKEIEEYMKAESAPNNIIAADEGPLPVFRP